MCRAQITDFKDQHQDEVIQELVCWSQGLSHQFESLVPMGKNISQFNAAFPTLGMKQDTRDELLCPKL